MRIKFIKSPGLYKLAYFVGDEINIDDNTGNLLIKENCAIKIIREEKKEIEKDVIKKIKRDKS